MGTEAVTGTVGGADQFGTVGGADQFGTVGGADQFGTVGGADQFGTVGGADQFGAVGGADEFSAVGGADEFGTAVDPTGAPVDAGGDATLDSTVDASAVVAELYRRDVSTQTFGIELVDAGPGRAVVSMVVRPDMCNGYDVCHGGMTFTLADTAMAFASGSHNQTALAVAASIDFLRPVPHGSRLRATAEERWLKGRTGLYDVRIELDDGTLVAVFHGRTVRAGGAVVVPHGDGHDHDLGDADPDAEDLDTRGGA